MMIKTATPRPSRSTSGRCQSDEKALGPDHPNVASALNNLTVLYDHQDRYADALPLVRRTISNKTAKTRAVLPALFGGRPPSSLP